MASNKCCLLICVLDENVREFDSIKQCEHHLGRVSYNMSAS